MRPSFVVLVAFLGFASAASASQPGHPIDGSDRVPVDLYFAGVGKTFRAAYSKIISFEPYTDGFGIMRDAATSKPQIFVTGYGWFSYNLVTNLAQR